MGLNGLKCISNTTHYYFFLSVENAPVRTPPQVWNFPHFFFDGFPYLVNAFLIDFGRWGVYASLFGTFRRCVRYAIF